MNLYILGIIAAIMAFIVTAVLGKLLIPALRRLKFGQSIIEDYGPVWHARKAGTPTMGGIMFIISIIFCTVVALLIAKLSGMHMFSDYSVIRSNEIIKLISCAFLALAFGCVGMTDDYVKIKNGRNLGLTELQKTIPEILIIAAFLLCLGLSGNTVMIIPTVGKIAIEGTIGKIVYYIFSALVIYGAVNSVNFTDGLDGLCAGVTAPVGLAFALMAIMYGMASSSVIGFVLLGAMCGYFIWNHHPAKVMMGDTGSNFLGGLIVGLAYAIDCPLILLPVGIVYVIEGLSDVLQIACVVLFKKKIFKMAPIHHHFEMSGWSEKKIVGVFTLISVIGCFFGVYMFKMALN